MRWTPYVVAAMVAVAPAPALASQWLAYFDYGQAQMNSEGEWTARSVASFVNANPSRPYRLWISSHMDTAEAREFSDDLARQRAQAMATALVELGLDPARIDLLPRGATQLARATGDDVREPLNRRLIVEIIFEQP
jgi:outer membrane protein OmpA-like peptidoglycan-associated protein